MIEEFHNLYKGGRCYVLANGPSLNDVDFSKLDAPVIGTNRVYLKHVPDYYVCVNPLVYEQFQDEIDNLACSKFISSNIHLPPTDGATDLHYLDTSYGEPAFRIDLTKPLWEGYTVTYVALQLAYYLGFSEVVILGLDHKYKVPKDILPNEEMVADSYDQNHFDPTYFDKGTKWNAPDLRMSEVAYAIARKAFEVDGRSIVNASSRTACTSFDLESLARVLSPNKPDVSAIVSAYFSEGVFESCIEDLMHQSLWYQEELEIVVVCQEGSPEHQKITTIKELLGDQEEFITVVATKDVPTVYKAWNLGVQAASGRFLTNANTDDRHSRLAYEILAATLVSEPSVDLVYHDSYITWKPNQTFDEFVEANSEQEVVAGREIDEPGIFVWPEYSRELLSDGCFIGPQPMWRASLHQLYGGFLDGWKSAGDYEFWLRISREGNMKHVPIVLGLYCGREDGIELGDPALSMEESSRAIMLHQEGSAQIKMVGPDHIKIAMGGKYAIAERSDFFDLVDKVREG